MSATTACQSVDLIHLQLGKYPSRFRPSGGPWGPALILARVTGPTLYDIDLNPGPLESFGTQTARQDHEQSLRRKRPGKINPWHSSRIIIQVFGPQLDEWFPVLPGIGNPEPGGCRKVELLRFMKVNSCSSANCFESQCAAESLHEIFQKSCPMEFFQKSCLRKFFKNHSTRNFKILNGTPSLQFPLSPV